MMRAFLSLRAVGVCLLCVAPIMAQSFVTGLVYQRQGNGVVPVPHPRVEARSTATGKILAEVIADDYGAYVLRGLPEGELVVMVSHPQFHTASRDYYEKGARLRCPGQRSCGALDFEMVRNGELAVRVVDAIGHFVEDVTVTVSSMNEHDEPMKPADFRDGRRVFYVSLRPGHYQVHTEPSERLRDIQYEPVTTEIKFEHGQRTKTVEIVLPSSRKYHVSGRVLGLELSDAAGMMITLTPLPVGRETDAQSRRFGAPLNRSGYFVLNGLSLGSYTIELTSLLGTSLPSSTNRATSCKTITVDKDRRGLLLSLLPEAAPKTAN